MKKFFFKITNLNEKHLYFSILISFFIIACYHFNSGFSMSGDSHKFSRWADDLIKIKFNLYEFFFKENSERISPFFFTVPVFLIAICKVIFGNGWQFAFLSLNLALVFFSLIIFSKTLLIIKIRPFLIFFTLPLIILSVDLLTWPKFILSDMNYAFLIILATYVMTKGFVENKYNYFHLFLIMILMIMTRPSSVPGIFAILFFITISKYHYFKRVKVIILFLFFLFISIPLVFGLLYYFIEFNFGENSQIEWWLLSKVKAGMIIHDRPETWVDSPSDFNDVVYIYFLRLINFFNPYAATFSGIHIFLNFIQTFLILLSIILWSIFGTLIRSYDKLFFFIIFISLSTASFHSFTLIDYDWRYRFPIILPMIMLFPISLEMIFRKFDKI